MASAIEAEAVEEVAAEALEIGAEAHPAVDEEAEEDLAQRAA